MAGGDQNVPAPVVHESVPREFTVKAKYLKDYGYTRGCRKCDAIKRGDQGHGNRSHNKECKDRIRECAQHDEVERSVIDMGEERGNEYIAKEIEKNDGVKKARIEVDEDIAMTNEPGTSSASGINPPVGDGGGNTSQSISSSSTSGVVDNPSRLSAEQQMEARKRHRDGETDEMEKERATHYQATEEPEKNDENMQVNNIELRGARRRGSTSALKSSLHLDCVIELVSEG